MRPNRHYNYDPNNHDVFEMFGDKDYQESDIDIAEDKLLQNKELWKIIKVNDELDK